MTDERIDRPSPAVSLELHSDRSARKAIAERIASRYESHFLRGYARWKLRTDPLYEAVAQRLAGHELPIVDVGCGIGLMSLYLRENGYGGAIVGIDHDAAKIAAAQRAAAGDPRLRFSVGDATDPLPAGSSVLLLDLIHYFDDETQLRIAGNAANAVAPGGAVMIRDALGDGSWRHRMTAAAEFFARAVRWMKAGRVNFPSRDRLLGAFPGFSAEVVPLWGGTPFNNYLFVFRRSKDGIAKE